MLTTQFDDDGIISVSACIVAVYVTNIIYIVYIVLYILKSQIVLHNHIPAGKLSSVCTYFKWQWRTVGLQGGTWS